MAHHKSALKRIRQTVKRNLANRDIRSTLRTSIKNINKFIEAGDSENATKELPIVQKKIDRAVTRGILHRKTALRKISRLMISINKINTKVA